jgi:hypothetical protein
MSNKAKNSAAKGTPGARSRGMGGHTDPPIVVKSGGIAPPDAVTADMFSMEMDCLKSMNSSFDSKDTPHPFHYCYPIETIPIITGMEIVIDGQCIFKDSVEKKQWTISMFTAPIN